MAKRQWFDPHRGTVDHTVQVRIQRVTRIRLFDDHGLVGEIFTVGDADDAHIASLIPDGCRAMVSRNRWPLGIRT